MHFTSRSARDTESDILKKKLSNKALLINTGLNIVFELNQQKNKEAQRKHSCSERNSMFLTTAVTAFFFNSDVVKIWSEFLRVKLYRNYLKGNKIYFKLVGG